LDNILPGKPKGISKHIARITSVPEIGILIPLILLVAIIGIIKPIFFSVNNLSAVITGLAFIGIVSVGETMVILFGEIDISLGSIAGLGAILATWFATKPHWDPIISIVMAVLICALLGLINGLLNVKIKMPSFIVTIGMLYMAKGAIYVISKGYPIYPLPAMMNKIGNFTLFSSLSLAFIIFIFLIIVFEFVLRKTNYGRYVYATGDNIQVAKLAGINVDTVKISAFVISGLLAGVAGILATLSLESGIATTGSGWEMQAIAASAIGGISLLGGSGTMIGTMIGMFILGVLNSGLVLIGMDTNWQTISVGVVMVIAVWIDIIRRNKKVKA
jgi:ribose transport system permease protein